ncbi:MAG: TetR/AcrR family transcriptional regulator [Stenotrophobium sp.]
MSYAGPVPLKLPARIVPVTARGEATRRKLLSAAALEFGEKGFHLASVSSITLRAGVGQGTFYLYFRTKEEVFITLVQDIGGSLCKHTAQTLAHCTGKLAVEQASVESFIDFAQRHPGSLRIVQEAQFVDEPAYRDYHASLAKIYGGALSRVSGAGGTHEAGDSDADVQAWALTGVCHFIAMRYCLWPGQPPAPQVLAQVMRMIGAATRSTLQ